MLNATLVECGIYPTITRQPLGNRIIERRARAARAVRQSVQRHHFGQVAKRARKGPKRPGLWSGATRPKSCHGGGTEATTSPFAGAEALEATGRKHLIATAIEHEAVQHPEGAARRGWKTRPCGSIKRIVSRTDRGGAVDDTRRSVCTPPRDRTVNLWLAGAHRQAREPCFTPTRCRRQQDSGDVKALGVDLLRFGAQVLRPRAGGTLDSARRAAAAADDRRQTGAQPRRRH